MNHYVKHLHNTLTFLDLLPFQLKPTWRHMIYLFKFMHFTKITWGKNETF